MEKRLNKLLRKLISSEILREWNIFVCYNNKTASFSFGIILDAWIVAKCVHEYYMLEVEFDPDGVSMEGDPERKRESENIGAVSKVICMPHIALKRSILVIYLLTE